MAAEQAHVQAQFNLVFIYKLGHGVQKDVATALSTGLLQAYSRKAARSEPQSRLRWYAHVKSSNGRTTEVEGAVVFC